MFENKFLVLNKESVKFKIVSYYFNYTINYLHYFIELDCPCQYPNRFKLNFKIFKRKIDIFIVIELFEYKLF